MSGPPLNGKCLKSQWLQLNIKKDEDFLKLFCWLPPRIRRNENWESFPPNRRQQSLLTSATPPVIEKTSPLIRRTLPSSSYLFWGLVLSYSPRRKYTHSISSIFWWNLFNPILESKHLKGQLGEWRKSVTKNDHFLKLCPGGQLGPPVSDGKV